MTSMPFYVAPEQQIQDRADFARKGIARGRSVVVQQYADGICCVAENRSSLLYKISEIYDRICFAGVGRYNEFAQLRTAGIRHADMRGYAYAREDVTARGLANAYAQLLGGIFSGAEKPYEVELIVAELGMEPEHDEIFQIGFDGSLTDQDCFAVMGGEAQRILGEISDRHDPSASLSEAVQSATLALFGGEPVDPVLLEIGVLDRTGDQRRKFRRLATEQIPALLA